MENYYEILGVNEKATSSEIKRAYFKMIRKYSPEKDEKNFKRVREAYEVLSDPVTKGEYDNLMVISPLLRSNFLTAKEEMERGAFSNAIERLKEMLRYQDVDLIRATLADAYLLNENSGNAIKLYEALVNKYPSQNIYKSKLGSAYVMRGWHKKALPIIKEALSHDEEDIGNWLALSEAYAAADELVEAIEVLEKGLKKDFDLSFKNILLFSKWQKQMMWWSLCDQDPDEEKKIANEIKAHVAKLKAETSPNDDLREMMAGMLMELCQKATLISCFEVAGVCINRIQTLVSLDSKMKEIVSQFEMQINMGSEIQNFFEDEIMDDMFIELIECYIIPYESLNMSRSEYDFNRMLGAAELAMHYKKYAAQLQKLKEKYPKLYAQGREFFERLEQPSERKKIVKQQKNKVRRQSDYIENLLYGLADFDDDDDDIFWSEAKQETVRKQKIGRNEPCPCGSGKKYKQCCGRN